MISEIVNKRVIEAKREQIAKSVKASREEYKSGKSGKETVKPLQSDFVIYNKFVIFDL